mgnify:FL=1|jgi:sodium-coupled neutral amino acid transporter 9
MSGPLTLVALMNAMIGGTILVLPLMFLGAGYLPAIIVTLITGAINYYSCKVCYDHLQDDADLPECIYRHTKKRIWSKLYDTMVYISIQLLLLLYFNLIVKQWETILMAKSFLITLINGVAVFALVFLMRKFNAAVSLMGYGILSIVGYMVFVAWLWGSAPSGNNHYPVASWKFADLCDTLATAFSMQGIFVPILRKNHLPSQNGRLLILAYVLGGLVYSYIGFAGSFGNSLNYEGILNRQPIDGTPETVEDYFQDREW